MIGNLKIWRIGRLNVWKSRPIYHQLALELHLIHSERNSYSHQMIFLLEHVGTHCSSSIPCSSFRHQSPAARSYIRLLLLPVALLQYHTCILLHLGAPPVAELDIYHPTQVACPLNCDKQNSNHFHPEVF